MHITQAILERRNPDDTKPETVADYIARTERDATNKLNRKS